jgi:hypothetical protein
MGVFKRTSTQKEVVSSGAGWGKIYEFIDT